MDAKVTTKIQKSYTIFDFKIFTRSNSKNFGFHDLIFFLKNQEKNALKWEFGLLTVNELW